MLEPSREEEIGLTAIDRLNELLEAERAGVDTLSRLFPEARSPEMAEALRGGQRRRGLVVRRARPLDQDDGRDHL